MNADTPSFLSARHRLNAIAMEGLRFSETPYDIDGYNRRLEVTASGYAEALGTGEAQMLEQLRCQIGVVP